MLKDLIEAAARKYSFDINLIAAMVKQESDGDPLAIRFEPGFFRRYLSGKPLNDLGGFVPSENRVTRDTERTLRACSFGLMQIMGQVAREIGYSDPSLTRLLIPDINLEWGCKYLSRLRDKFKTDVEPERTQLILLRWNGGGDPSYPNKVLAHISTNRISSILT